MPDERRPVRAAAAHERQPERACFPTLSLKLRTCPHHRTREEAPLTALDHLGRTVAHEARDGRVVRRLEWGHGEWGCESGPCGEEHTGR